MVKNELNLNEVNLLHSKMDKITNLENFIKVNDFDTKLVSFVRFLRYSLVFKNISSGNPNELILSYPFTLREINNQYDNKFSEKDFLKCINLISNY